MNNTPGVKSTPRVKSSPPILVISGWRGVGKTTLCQRLVDTARAAGWDVAGLLSPARFEAGKKTGIQVEDLRSSERRLLASLLPGELQGSRLGPWIFDDELFAWGNQVLRSAIPCDLLVIDELGPLEFDSGGGWSGGFQAIASRAYRLAVVVIRPEYLTQFLERWPEADGITLSNPTEVNASLERIANQFTQKNSP